MEIQAPTVNPNLTSAPTFSYKDILVKKLSYAVASCVISQIIILFIYIIIANASIYPREWLASILSTFTHLSTWVFVLIFSAIIFAECLICSKDYVLMKSYCSTRFQQFCHVFSIHNLILLLLHAVTGGAFVWQILSIVDSSNRNLLTSCKGKRTCLVEDTFFLIIGGLWTGFYYFVKVYMSSKNLTFPVIQQAKYLQLRSSLYGLFKKSFILAIWPTLYFIVIYYFFGYQLENRFTTVFGLDKSFRESSILVYFYSWWLSILYFFSMDLMRFFFQLFLTEPVQFPLIKENPYILTLQEALIMDTLPAIQHLACLDLFLLSQWSSLRRSVLFTLSQPGAHPHNWNSLTESILKLFTDYTNLLKRSLDNAPLPNPAPVLQNEYTSHICPSVRYRNFRDMTSQSDHLDIVNVSSNMSSLPNLESMKNYLCDTLNKTISFLKIFFGINFLFGELPQVNIQRCLGNGQLIVWSCQGISELVGASLAEDKYGIVQKDLPVIVTTLVQLKQNLDKLSKVLSMSRKGGALDDENHKKKNAVNAAVKRSLMSICFNFGQYFNDFPISSDVRQYIQANLLKS